tara:strand:- start:474 stop:2549 length:2076 start_codon:yes stop_codon:yes gene_type:complete
MDAMTLLRQEEERREKPRSEAGRTSWLDTDDERDSVACALSVSFLTTIVVAILAGVTTLSLTPKDDVAFEDLNARLREPAHNVSCLRAARRADYTVVFLGLGSPSQYLKLLLRLDQTRGGDASTEPSMVIFSERMHKSTTMRCDPFDPPRTYEAECKDVAMVFQGSRDQRYVRTRFTFANDHVEYSYNNRAALLNLDGSLYLRHGTTYWLTTTHLCFAPISDTDDVEPVVASDGVLPVHVVNDTLRSDVGELVHFKSDLPVAEAYQMGDCSGPGFFDTGVRLFPADAASERITWLSLSDTFLYEYGNPVLRKRREVVEMGKACADARLDVAHVNDLYRLDCAIIDPTWCQEEPSMPFRRLATTRMRLDLRRDESGGVLRASESRALALIPFLASYNEGLWLAFGRLVIMLLTAAVVFVRGSQNASSSRYMFSHVLDTILCRDLRSKSPINIQWAMQHNLSEIIVDASITAVALLSRILVYAYSVRPLIADQLSHVVVFEAIGIAVSTTHFALRYVVLKWDLAHEAPLTKLSGPMSICDVASAVLLAFAETPLLSNDEGRFPAVGRLLIGILTSISVLTRCFFAAPMCAVLANTVTNDKVAYADLKGYQTVLVTGAVLWTVQGAVACANLCALFIGPATYALVRSTVGDAPLVVPYCLFFGLLCAGLPTITKVGLRTLEHECGDEKDGPKSQ